MQDNKMFSGLEIGDFKHFCIQQRKAVTDLVENARMLQSLRSKNSISPKI